MEEGSDQVRAWKDGEDRDADHPAGEVKVTRPLAAARVAILAGFVGAMGAVTPLCPTTPTE